MAGHVFERFVDLSEEDSNQLSCFICKNILMDPVVAQCCQQEFCRQCILESLKVSPNCPVSNGPLIAAQLINPSRIIQNRLKKLKIHCDNQEKGCQQVVELGDLSSHLQVCPFKDSDCGECPKSQCIVESGQKCIRNLDKEFRNLKALNSMMKRREDYRHPQVISTNMNPQQSRLAQEVVTRYHRVRRNLQCNADRMARMINRHYANNFIDGTRGLWRCSAYCQESGDNNVNTYRLWCCIRFYHALFVIHCQNPLPDNPGRAVIQ